MKFRSTEGPRAECEGQEENRFRFNRHEVTRGAAPCTSLLITALVTIMAGFVGSATAQDALPFEVSNPKNLEWSTEEAGRIYSSACELVAREIRPDKPPHLTPKFVLVLGTQDDETVRTGTTAEVHLRSWDPSHFAEAMVLMASREILKSDDILHLTRDTLTAAQASVSVAELKRKK